MNHSELGESEKKEHKLSTEDIFQVKNEWHQIINPNGNLQNNRNSIWGRGKRVRY